MSTHVHGKNASQPCLVSVETSMRTFKMRVTAKRRKRATLTYIIEDFINFLRDVLADDDNVISMFLCKDGGR